MPSLLALSLFPRLRGRRDAHLLCTPSLLFGEKTVRVHHSLSNSYHTEMRARADLIKV